MQQAREGTRYWHRLIKRGYTCPGSAEGAAAGYPAQAPANPAPQLRPRPQIYCFCGTVDKLATLGTLEATRRACLEQARPSAEDGRDLVMSLSSSIVESHKRERERETERGRDRGVFRGRAQHPCRATSQHCRAISSSHFAEIT